MTASAMSAGTAAETSKSGEGDRSGRARIVIGLLVVLLALAAIGSISAGAASVPAVSVLMEMAGLDGFSEVTSRDRIVVEAIRLPRVLLGICVGAALAMSGAIMQGLFRNPLADPGIIGVTAGASFGAIATIVLGGTVLAPVVALLGLFALPAAAFVGAAAACAILYLIATEKGRTSVATMLLGGIALAALAGAAGGIFIYLADDAQLRDITFWSLGSLAGASWDKLLAAGPIIGATMLGLPFLAKTLNALALGEAAAGHLGVHVQRMKVIALTMAAASTGAAVAVSGGIGFVGIVAPHLLRLTIGPDHRYLLPASALLGGAFLIGADLVSRLIVAPAELPIGIVTALVGAPFFIWILLRQRNALTM